MVFVPMTITAPSILLTVTLPLRVLLFVLQKSMHRECEGAMVTAMLVWVMEEVWLRRMQGMWVVHVVKVFCPAQLTCYGWVWCVGDRSGGVCEMCMRSDRGCVGGEGGG